MAISILAMDMYSRFEVVIDSASRDLVLRLIRLLSLLKRPSESTYIKRNVNVRFAEP